MKNSKKDFINQHLEILRSLQTAKGLFLASKKGVATGYDRAWLRDNFYTTLAFEETENCDIVKKAYRAILDIFLKHEHKISWAAQNKPHESWQYIHARYNPETFEEYWEGWGNKQNDAVGAILFKLGDLEEKGQGVIKAEEDKKIVQRLADYLNSIEYWQDPDSGMWEENEEIHASSVGAVLAGLKKIKSLSYLNVPDDLISKGQTALDQLLPRESESKFCDLAQLSLIYPYDLADHAMAKQILENIEYFYQRSRGVIRYKNDKYYNKNKDGFSEEAEWTMALPWLAIVYNQIGDKDKAKFYLNKAKSLLIGNQLPELYYSNSDKANDNIPLAWAESLLIIAFNKII